MVVADRYPQLPRKLLFAFFVSALPEPAGLEAGRRGGGGGRAGGRCVDESDEVPGRILDRCPGRAAPPRAPRRRALDGRDARVLEGRRTSRRGREDVGGDGREGDGRGEEWRASTRRTDSWRGRAVVAPVLLLGDGLESGGSLGGVQVRLCEPCSGRRGGRVGGGGCWLWSDDEASTSGSAALPAALRASGRFAQTRVAGRSAGASLLEATATARGATRCWGLGRHGCRQSCFPARAERRAGLWGFKQKLNSGRDCPANACCATEQRRGGARGESNRDGKAGQETFCGGRQVLEGAVREVHRRVATAAAAAAAMTTTATAHSAQGCRELSLSRRQGQPRSTRFLLRRRQGAHYGMAGQRQRPQTTKSRQLDVHLSLWTTHLRRRETVKCRKGLYPTDQVDSCSLDAPPTASDRGSAGRDGICCLDGERERDFFFRDGIARHGKRYGRGRPVGRWLGGAGNSQVHRLVSYRYRRRGSRPGVGGGLCFRLVGATKLATGGAWKKKPTLLPRNRDDIDVVLRLCRSGQHVCTSDVLVNVPAARERHQRNPVAGLFLADLIRHPFQRGSKLGGHQVCRACSKTEVP